MLEDYDKAFREREQQRKEHHKMMTLRKKRGARLMTQILVGSVTLIVGLVLVAARFMILFRLYG